jgi:elongation factor Ts
VAEQATELVATIGENIGVRRTAVLSVPKGAVASYVHAASAPGLGRIGVLVALESAGDPEKLAALAKQIAMHIAAARPEAVSADQLDPKLVEREKALLTDQAKESGKPDNVVAKMVEGRIKKFYQDVVLLEQVFVVDNESRVSQVVEKAGKELGSPVKVAGFLRFGLGEGLEKKADDFAAEVASLTR